MIVNQLGGAEYEGSDVSDLAATLLDCCDVIGDVACDVVALVGVFLAFPLGVWGSHSDGFASGAWGTTIT